MEETKRCATCGDLCTQLSGPFCLKRSDWVDSRDSGCDEHYAQAVWHGTVRTDLVEGQAMIAIPDFHPAESLAGKAVRITVTEIVPGRKKATVPLPIVDIESVLDDLKTVREIDADSEEIDAAIDAAILMLERGLKR